MSTRSRSKRPTKRARTSRSKSTARRSLSYTGARATRTVAIAGPSVGLGTSATTVLRTSFFTNVLATIGTGVWSGFLKPGSCFDPSGDLAAMQPQMFDQFAAMYNRYKVNSFTVRIKINGQLGSNATGVVSSWVGAAYPAISSTPPATYQGAASQQYAKTTSGSFNMVAVGAATYGVGAEGKYLTFKMKQADVVGDRVNTYDNGALVTADPTALQYALLPIFLQGAGSGEHAWMLEVDIWQNVTFTEKKNTVDA